MQAFWGQFAANIGNLASVQEASLYPAKSSTGRPGQLKMHDSELSSMYAGTDQPIKNVIVFAPYD